MKLLFLPGFLGAKEDWAEVIAQLPEHTCIPLDYPFLLEPADVLIGYGLGGRLALQEQQKFPVIAIGASTGIEDNERLARRIRDEKWASLLETLPFDDFLNEWYSQSLFASLKEKKERFEKMLERRQKGNPHQWADILRKYSVSRFAKLDQFSPTTFFVHGKDDHKYAEHYRYLPQVKIIDGSGHAPHIENPEALAKTIRDILMDISKNLL